jgi:hypothetical protein
MYTDGIEVLGVVRRMSFHMLVQLEDGSREWHYFGTLATDTGKEPTTADPVFEHVLVQIPNDMDNIPSGFADQLFFDLAQIAGMYRESIG